MELTIKPVAYVQSPRIEIEDDLWGDVVSEIELTEAYHEESLQGIESFSHIEVIFAFHQVSEDRVEINARHPRNNQAWPAVGIFAQRGKNRPNRIGTTIVQLLKREGKKLYVKGLDAIDQTPVIDIKPVMQEFLPDKQRIAQPSWVSELMQNYWQKRNEGE